MADSILNSDLAPVTWTSGPTAREPRPEGRERGPSGKRSKDPNPSKEKQTSDESETPKPQTSESPPHKLDSFA